MGKRVSTIIRPILCIFFAVLPAAAALFLIYYTQGKNIFDFVPAYSDEIAYWHQILTFKKAGFSGGYYGLNEWIPKISFFHFGPHGPILPFIYGIFSYFTGWDFCTFPIINMVLLSVILFFFLYCLRLSFWVASLLTLLLITFNPLINYIPTNMMETLNQILAIIFAFIFFCLLNPQNSFNKWQKIICFAFICIASLVRISWAFMFLPFFLFTLQNISLKESLKALFKSGALVLFFYLNFKLSSAPFPSPNTMKIAEAMKLSFFDGIKEIINITLGSFADVFSVQKSLTIELGLIYQLLFVLGYFLIMLLFRTYKEKGHQNFFKFINENREPVFHVYNLGLIFFITSALSYANAWRQYRVLAPYLLISILLIVLYKRYRLAITILLVNLFLFSSFINVFSGVRFKNFHYPKQYLINARSELETMLKYDSQAKSPWCNTLIINTKEEFPWQSIPEGIGWQILFENYDYSLPLNSRYIVVSAATYEKYRGKMKLKLLGQLGKSFILENLNIAC